MKYVLTMPGTNLRTNHANNDIKWDETMNEACPLETCSLTHRTQACRSNGSSQLCFWKVNTIIILKILVFFFFLTVFLKWAQDGIELKVMNMSMRGKIRGKKS